MAEEAGDPLTVVENIYKVARRIKRTEHTVYNALRSIYEDSLFVGEIRAVWTELPMLANLRCGLWYAPEFDGTCYFKSTDGHNGNWSLSTTRLNLHVATLAAERGGCYIVDATRKGKRFPDSLSKTIPIWACVLNRALADFRLPHTQETVSACSLDAAVQSGANRSHQDTEKGRPSEDWDSSLHLPIWVSQVEKANIESRIDGWVEALNSTGADLVSLAKVLKKPLRPLWISQKTIIWLNEVPQLDDWPFTPIILLSASRPSLFIQRFTDVEFSWRYIPGAADDEESWARGLTPALFWKNSLDILRDGPSSCNAKVADIVERDRVYRAVRGQHAPQVRVNAGSQSLPPAHCSHQTDSEDHGRAMREQDEISVQAKVECTGVRSNGWAESTRDTANEPKAGLSSWGVSDRAPSKHMIGFHWIGDTGLAVGNAECGNTDSIYEVVDCIINCGTSRIVRSNQKESYLYLPIVGSKFDRHSLQKSLGDAISFTRTKLSSGFTIFIYCSSGEDISVCVCLAVLLSCFGAHGQRVDEMTSNVKVVKKSDVREQLIYLSSFNTNARPSRGSLRQVFNFFNTSRGTEDDLENSVKLMTVR